jgi:hypothetical protein
MSFVVLESADRGHDGWAVLGSGLRVDDGRVDAVGNQPESLRGNVQIRAVVGDLEIRDRKRDGRRGG